MISKNSIKNKLQGLTFSSPTKFQQRKLYLYILLTIERFGDRMWQVVTTFLIQEWTEKGDNISSLRYISIFYLVPVVIIAIALPVLGSKINRFKRFNVLLTLTLIQNIGVVISSLIFVWQLLIAEKNFVVSRFMGFLSLLILIQSITELCSKTAGQVCIKRDWIVIVAEQNAQEQQNSEEEKTKTIVLAEINSWLTIIDMTVNLFSAIPPLLLWDFTNVYWLIGFVVVWNVLSCSLEIFCMVKLKGMTAALGMSPSSPNPEEVPEQNSESSSKTTKNKISTKFTFKKISKPIKLFYNDHLFIAGLSLSMVYFTILGDNGVTRYYYLANCFRKSIIAVIIALCAVFGIIGGRLIQFLITTYSDNLFKPAKIASMVHWPAYFLCVAGIIPAVPGSLFEPTKSLNGTDLTIEELCFDQETGERTKHYTISIILFALGVILGRIGLWSFDIAVTQLFQEKVPENRRNIIGSIQMSLNMILEMLMYICVIIIDKNYLFGYHVISSTVAICLAHLIFQVKYFTE